MPHGFYRQYGKRLLDVALTTVGLLVLALPLAALAALVRWRLGSPVLFRQQRTGRDGATFTIFKFRTMTDACDAGGRLLPDAERLTRFGRFLRSSSLDEFPELWNVLRGEMSLVGPRPLLPEYLDRYTPEQARRHDVLPGITGWAQVNGRNRLGWEEKFALDVWYVEHQSLWLDLKILAQTVLKVFQRDGISAEGHATAPVFQGGSKSADVVVIGAGGHAKVVVSTLRAAGYRVAGLYDDRSELWGGSVLDVPIVGPVAAAAEHRGPAVLGIGDNRVRQRLAASLPLDWLTVVHPAAWVDSSVELGPGTVVFAGAVIQPGASLGVHTIVNTAATIDHDCRLGDFVHVAPGAHLTGNVCLQDGVFLGAGAVAIPGTTVGRRAMVGAGATIINDLPADVVAVGCPARAIRSTAAPKAA